MKHLEVVNITKKVKGSILLDNVSFSVGEGEVVSLIGTNGAGKSTIIKIVSHLIFPDSGQVFICENDLAEKTVEALSCVSASIEAPALYTQFTGRQHLELVATLRKKSKDDVEKQILFCGLGDKINQRVTKYSLGMKQRLYLSMSLLANPKLLILDEPTNGLDFSGVCEFCDEIKNLANSGVAILLSSHILSDLSRVSDKFVFIDKGKILNVIANDATADIESIYINTFKEN